MKPKCQKIRDTLATDGPQALRGDETARQHLAECEECFAFLESLSQIDTGLGSMPQIDAPDEVVEHLLARPELAAPPPASLWDRFVSTAADLLRPRPLVWSGVAGALVIIVVGVGLLRETSNTQSLGLEGLRESVESIGVLRSDEKPDEQGELSPEQIERLKSLGYVGEIEESPADRKIIVRKYVPPPPRPDASEIKNNERAGGEGGQSRREQVGENKEDTRFSDDYVTDLPVPGRFYRDVLTPAPGVQDPDGEDNPDLHGSRSRDFQDTVSGVDNVDPLSGERQDRISTNSIEEMEVVTSGAAVEFGKAQGGFAELDETNRRLSESETPADKFSAKQKAATPPPSGPLFAGGKPVNSPILLEDSRVRPEFPAPARAAGIEAQVVLQAFVRADGSVGTLEVLTCNRPGMGFEEAALEAVKQWRYEPATVDGKPVDVFFTITVDFDLDDPPADNSALDIDDAVRTARAFLDERDATEGLAFKSANGYWKNTYVPGDAATRLLQARLAGWDRSVFQNHLPSVPRLHEASNRIGQPFDTPDASAIAVYLQADRRGVPGEGRMLLQVGLEGTPRHGGRRPAMNLALVLDLRNETSADVALGVRSLIEAFNRAKEPGDRFRVFVAGKSGGLVVPAEDFRHGFLKVTLDRLISGTSVEHVPTHGIVEVVSDAISSVAAVDDPDAPLGSSAVILVTGQAFGSDARTLAGLAHQGAVSGVPLSVVGIGSEVEPAEIELVTLAGQGNRRILDSPSAAAELVDRELSAVSRAIARAVRLRVRLAPGVKLVDVLGSERLDEARAQRVRDAEKSIDLRLSRNLGIEADRGDDEDGIQIVIPSFYAGDSHVILLDVVAPGPGPLAEVTVRYKDLVQLRNGVSRASLDLGRDTRTAGPLERNVLKNLLSFRLSQTLDRAGRAVSASDTIRATTLLEEFADLLEGLRHELPGLDNDPEVRADLVMLDEYRSLLAGGFAARPDQRDFLADSLCYAARLKIQPRPLEIRS
jgi:TonB family protein